ncbi:hypothetical protein K1X76_10565 [bacterium]|nr:hypothetical protein [bacterium]
MIGIVLITENKEADEMLKTARRLLCKTNGIKSLVLKPGQPVSKMKASLKKAIHQVDGGRGVLLLTDFYGSTQCNVCMQFLKKGSVELLTGFNLPMLVKLSTLHQTLSLNDLVPFIENYGRDHIRRVVSKKGT